nr:reverse transcriptase domain-containing protein [Tanacetum cinerariifolium]
MSTHSSARNLFPPLDNPELTIRRRSHADPTLLNDFEMVAEGNGDLPVLDLRTIEELCQPSLNGRGGPIAPIAIQAMNFGLKNDMIQQVQNSCQFHVLSGDDADKHLDKFLHVTHIIKVNGVTDDAHRLYLFPYSLTHHATAWFDRLPRNSINTFEQMAKMFLAKYFSPSVVTKLRNEITNFHQRGTFMKRRPGECYDLIENMIAHHNDWDTSAQRSESSSSINSSSDTEIAALKAEMAKINKNLMRPPLATLRMYMLWEPTKGASHGQNRPPAYQAPSYQAPIYQAPVHQPQIPQPQVVTNNEFTNFMKANNVILKNMQTNMTSLINSNLELKNMFGQFMKMNTASSSGSGTLLGNTITNPKEELKGITTRSGTAYQGPMIPTTSSSLPPVVEHETEATKDTVHPTNNGSIKDVQPPVVQNESPILNYEPIVASTIEPVVDPVSASKPNQRLSIPYLSRLHDQKLRNKANDQKEKFFQIFKDLNFNISFVDALILMPKFGPSIKSLLTKKEKLFKLARTLLNEHCSTVFLKKLPEKLRDPGKFLIPCDFLEMAECLALADLGASINLSHYVYVKVGKFHFPTDFVVIDFDADPRVPLILERSFLKTERALIDVFDGELTLRVGKEAITFNLDQTSRYSANYNEMTANRIDVIVMACEEYSQEVINFSYVIAGGNPTPYYDPIVSTTSPTLTLFGESDFLLEEVDAFLTLEDDFTSPEVDQSYELKICEAKSDKSSIDEPPEVELKDLPPHLEYAFLEGDDKLPIIIAKDLSVEEKTALVTVLKSHKRAIAWKLSDIKGIDPKFCTHKILMEEYFEPAGSFTVVENEENELIPTRLATGWRVFIDNRKLNEATRKDHFPLPFMDQMLERLAGNKYYCFLDGFSGYFQIPIDPKDQEKTTFTCPYGTFTYRRMPFGLCNAPGTFQRCMMAIFHDMIEKTREVFMDDFLVFGNSFQTCLSHLEKMLKRCEDTNLCLNWEKSHFMVREGIILGHNISKEGIEVDKAKVEVIAKFPHPTTVMGIRSFLGHVGFCRRFIQDFSKIARPMTRLLEKYTPFFFSKECVESFQTLKRKLTEAPILIAPDWDFPFELMCDASDFAICAVLEQCQEKHFRPIHYASKTMTEAESNYTITEKEMLAVVYAFEKFRSYLIMNKSIYRP